MKTLILCLVCSPIFAADNIEVAVKFIDAKVRKLEPIKEEAVQVSFVFEGKRTPNEVGFTIYTAIPGWTCTGTFGQKDWKKNGTTCMWPSETYGEDRAMMSWECIRPNQPKLDLVIEATEPKEKSKEKEKYAHFKSVSPSDCKNMARHRIFVKVLWARAWSEREMAENEFMWSEKCRGYVSTWENSARYRDFNPKKGLTVLIWNDLKPEEEAKARTAIAEEAKRLGVKLEEIKKDKRCFRGGMAEDPILTMTPQTYGAVILLNKEAK